MPWAALVPGGRGGGPLTWGRSCARSSQPEDLGHRGPATGAPGLDGALRDVEDLGGLGDAESLHVDQDQRQPLALGELREGGPHVEADVDGAVAVPRLDGLVVAEAAAVLDVAEGTVKSRCSRGREAMARILDAAGHGPDGGGS